MFGNKLDESGTVVRNKARLVARGYNQEEGVEYDEAFTPLLDLKLLKWYLHLHLLWTLSYVKQMLDVHYKWIFARRIVY